MSNVKAFLDDIKVCNCGLTKIRIGNEHDGGYVVYNELCEMSKTVYSAGIGDDVGFELDWVNRWPKARVIMYDPTIEKLPKEHKRFTLHRFGIGVKYKPLSNIVPNSTLKLDIEWDEWGALMMFHEAELIKLAQIIVELHLIHVEPRENLSPYFYRFYSVILDKINEDLFDMYHMVMKRLANWFYIFHIHANNSLPLIGVDGFHFPPLLEVSFVRKDLVGKHELTKEVFPIQGLDLPNKTNRPDILDYYPFFGESYVERTFEAGTPRLNHAVKG